MDKTEIDKIRKVGNRIYYSGDMANMPSYGTITQLFPEDRYAYNSLEITFDDERFEGDTKKTIVPVCVFGKGPGQRFMLAEDYLAKRRQQVMSLYERMGKSCPPEILAKVS